MAGNKNLIFMILAGVLGLVAAGLSYVFLEQQKAFFMKKYSQVETEEEVRVAVPRGNLVAGQVLKKSHMAVRRIPVSLFSDQMLTPQNFQPALGQRLLVSLERGRPIHWAYLEGGRSPLFSQKIQPGRRVYILSVDQYSSYNSLIRPGDYVDLMLNTSVKVDTASTSQQGAQDKDKKAILPLVQNVRVLAVDETMNTALLGPDSDSPVTTITIELSPEELALVELAKGKLLPVLRNRDDRMPLPFNVISEDDMLVELYNGLTGSDSVEVGTTNMILGGENASGAVKGSLVPVVIQNFTPRESFGTGLNAQ